MSDAVTVRLADDGPTRYRVAGETFKPGDEYTVDGATADRLTAKPYFERVGEPDPTCAGNDGDCGRSVDVPGETCWQHSEN